jgi:hypothetical protein
MKALAVGLLTVLGVGVAGAGYAAFPQESDALIAEREPLVETQDAVATIRCARFPDRHSTAFNAATGRIDLPWRTDFPSAPPPARAPIGNFESNWQGYMASALRLIRDSGVRIQRQRVVMPADAEWWIAPWMDYSDNGREPINGLTKERGPDPGDLSPNSGEGSQVWAIGFYDARGAYALGRIFADPCDPEVPLAGIRFPEGTVSFKFLFTDAVDPDLTYLNGSPEVAGMIDPPSTGRAPGTGPRQRRTLRLLQLDIAVKDSRASETGWVFGTFIWRGPRRGDGLFDNMVPVGLMWGNDPGVHVSDFDRFAPLAETRLNRALDGVVWQRNGQRWPRRPWPGLHGRLNGPADNLRSSCLSCHALAQRPRSRRLNIVSRVPLDRLSTDENARRQIVREYMVNTAAGQLVRPDEAQPSTVRDAARPLDYSLQLEAGFARLCQACSEGRLSGATPRICQIRGGSFEVPSDTCGRQGGNPFLLPPSLPQPPPRQ